MYVMICDACDVRACVHDVARFAKCSVHTKHVVLIKGFKSVDWSQSQYSPEKRKEDEQRSSEELLGGMAAQTNGSPRSVNETEEADKAALQKDGMLLENGEQKQGVEDVIVMDDVDMEVLEVTNRAEGENGEDRENEREEDMEEGKQVRKVELREEKKGGEDDIEKARGEEGKEVIGEKGSLEQMVNIETRSEVEEDCRLARELALTARRTANSHKSPFAKVAGGQTRTHVSRNASKRPRFVFECAECHSIAGKLLVRVFTFLLQMKHHCTTHTRTTRASLPLIHSLCLAC